MKKPFGINFITFVSVFQIIFNIMTLFFLIFILSMNIEAAGDALTLQQSISLSLFNRPVEALSTVHYSIIVLGSLLPALILIMVMRTIKSKNIKFTRSLFFIKLAIDLLRVSILNIIIDLMMILVLYKDKKTTLYFSEKDI